MIFGECLLWEVHGSLTKSCQNNIKEHYPTGITVGKPPPVPTSGILEYLSNTIPYRVRSRLRMPLFQRLIPEALGFDMEVIPPSYLE